MTTNAQTEARAIALKPAELMRAIEYALRHSPVVEVTPSEYGDFEAEITEPTSLEAFATALIGELSPSIITTALAKKDAELARLDADLVRTSSLYIGAISERDTYRAQLAEANKALDFYADPKNWIDTPSWDGDTSCITEKAIPVTMQEGSQICDCGDVARRALTAALAQKEEAR